MQFARSRSVLNPDIEDASDGEWKTATERADAMERLVTQGTGPSKITEISEQLGLSKAMIYRLLARYRKNPAPSELLPRREGRTAGVGRLGDEVEDVIQGLIAGYYLKRQRPRIVDLHRQIALACRTRHLPPPSYKAVRYRVNHLDPALKVRAREGAKAARDRFGAVKRGLRPKKTIGAISDRPHISRRCSRRRNGTKTFRKALVDLGNRCCHTHDRRVLLIFGCSFVHLGGACNQSCCSPKNGLAFN